MIRFFVLALALIAAAVAYEAAAQDYSTGRLPVINPQPDLNGVDVASGQMTVELPFAFNAPGAGHLNSKAVFNGRMLTNSLNVYLEDQTLTRPDIGDPSSRQIRVHMGGVDRMFVCNGIGVCSQIAKIDGSMLTRTAEKAYNFRDRDGTQVTFFAMLGQDIWPQPCTDVETGCNAAGYFGYSWAKEIKFSNGETLTYSNFPTIEGSSYVNTVTSNLGYTYEALNACGSSCSVNTSNPGLYWLMHRAMPISATYRLKKSGTQLSSFAISRNLVSVNSLPRAGTIAAEDNVTVSDHAGRSSSIKLQAKWMGVCGSILMADGTGTPDWGMGSNLSQIDGTNFVPIRIVSPAGRETNISYLHFLQFAQGFNVIPVTSVTRGGSAWTYNYTINSWINNDVSLTATDPTGRQRSSRAVGYEVPWETVWGSSYWCSMQTTGSDVVQAKDGLNNTTNFGYQWQGTIGSATMPETNGYSYQYDTRGNLTQITATAKSASGLANQVVYQASFDVTCANPVKCNKPNWTRDGKGAQTDYVYDAVHGAPLSVTLPPDASGVRPQRRFAYETVTTPSGPLYRTLQTSECITTSSCIGTADELKTSLTYWGLTFLVATETLQLGNGGTALTTSYGYDNAGRLVQKTSPTGSSTWHFYDVIGRQIGTVEADPDVGGPLPHSAQRTTYNADDQVTKVETGTVTAPTVGALTSMTVSKTIDTTYDATGRKIEDRVSAGGVTQAVTQYGYDTADRLECKAERMNPASYASLPLSACVLGPEGSFGPDRIERNVYDAAGQLVKIQKAYGTPLVEDYVTYTFTPNGQQASITDAKGHVAAYAYDGFDRLAAWRMPSKANGAISAPCNIGTITETGGITGPTQSRSAGDDCEKYGYDRNGNRAFLVKRDGSVLTYQYDALNRMITKIVPDRPDLGSNHVRDVYYSYDLRGLMKSARYDSASGDGLAFVYDGFGRRTNSTITLYGASYSLGSTYDNDGNRASLTHPDGTQFGYARDALGRVTAVTQGATTIAGITYNSRGMRETLTGGIATNYGYDTVGRLNALGHDLSGSTHDVAFSYSYTPASQIATHTRNNDSYAWTGHYNVDRNYAVNGLNQFTSAGAANFCYDDNGNLTADGSRVYQYDVENRLVQTRAQVNSDCSALSLTGTQQTALRYDPLGRLYMFGGPVTAGQKLLFDGDALVAEYAQSGPLLRRFVHGSNVDEPLIWYEGGTVTTSALRRLRTDHQGSVVAVADNAGAIVGINRYDEYGIPGAGNIGTFQYTGQLWIADLGMYYYKARMYSPTIGRFLQVDPIGYEGGLNLYNYVSGDPINKTDPAGEAEYWCTVLVPVDGQTTVNCNYQDDGSLDTTVHVQTIRERKGDSSEISYTKDVYSFFNPFSSTTQNIETSVASALGVESIKLIPSPRRLLLEAAKDPRVRNLVNEYYRPGAKIGNGGAADAYRNDGSHLQKIQERERQIDRLLKDPNITNSDRDILNKIRDDIRDALGK